MSETPAMQSAHESTCVKLQDLSLSCVTICKAVYTRAVLQRTLNPKFNEPQEKSSKIYGPYDAFKAPFPEAHPATLTSLYPPQRKGSEILSPKRLPT